MSKPKGPIHCPIHEGRWSDKEPCVEPGASCAVLAEATILQDRLDVIAALAAEAREACLNNNGDVMTGVSVSAALETIRLLARSITEDDELRHGAFTVPGDDRALWTILRPRRVQPTGGGGEELHLPPKTRPTRLPGSARESEGGKPGSASVPAPTIANRATSEHAN